MLEGLSGPTISFNNLIVSNVASLTGLILSNLQLFNARNISALNGSISSLMMAVIE
jgi:hypothetical protein